MGLCCGLWAPVHAPFLPFPAHTSFPQIPQVLLHLLLLLLITVTAKFVPSPLHAISFIQALTPPRRYYYAHLRAEEIDA